MFFWCHFQFHNRLLGDCLGDVMKLSHQFPFFKVLQVATQSSLELEFPASLGNWLHEVFNTVVPLLWDPFKPLINKMSIPMFAMWVEHVPEKKKYYYTPEYCLEISKTADPLNLGMTEKYYKIHQFLKKTHGFSSIFGLFFCSQALYNPSMLPNLHSGRESRNALHLVPRSKMFFWSWVQPSCWRRVAPLWFEIVVPATNVCTCFFFGIFHTKKHPHHKL